MKTACTILALLMAATVSAADWAHETLVKLSAMEEFEKEGAFGTVSNFGVIMGNGVPLTNEGTPDLSKPGENGFLIMAFQKSKKDTFVAFLNRSPLLGPKNVETVIVNQDVFVVHEWGTTQGTMKRLKTHLQIE